MIQIDWVDLSWCAIPLACLLWVKARWVAITSDINMAIGRMLIQLIAVGYALVWMFSHPSIWLTLLILIFMLAVAAHIAIRPLTSSLIKEQKTVYTTAILSLLMVVAAHLLITIFLVLKLPTDEMPWYQPSIVLPLGGMYFASSMNSISLAGERYFAEREHGNDVYDARNSAFSASLMVQINGLLAVGLVTLPGMMTGQILSGVSPLIAVKYQILIMAMLLTCSGLTSALFLRGVIKMERA